MMREDEKSGLYNETLEKVAKRESELGEYDRSLESTRYRYFILGAKWQEQRMLDLIDEYNEMLTDSNVHEDHKEKSFKEWFEQFKK